MKRVVVFVGLFFAAIGCSSSSTSDPNLDAWTREVRVITPAQVGDRQYEEISGLEEQQRIGVSGEDDAISIAKQRLRSRAAKLDAHAVVIIACDRNVRSIDDNPMPTTEPMVICHGVAIRWKDN